MILTLISSSVNVESVSLDRTFGSVVFDAFRFDDVLSMFSLLCDTFCFCGDKLSSVVAATSFSAETIGWRR
jgi:hypothetical protein